MRSRRAFMVWKPYCMRIMSKKFRNHDKLTGTSSALGKPSDILTKLNEMAGFSPNEEIELYEEIKFEPNVMCEHIDKKLTFHSSQLEDGDIICFQKSPAPGGETQVVHFRSLDKPKDDDFSLELSKLDTYDDVVERVAHQLGLDDHRKCGLHLTIVILSNLNHNLLDIEE
ncbi:hypothetical protein EJB05_01615, partial [Eragrostis curvula]